MVVLVWYNTIVSISRYWSDTGTSTGSIGISISTSSGRSGRTRFTVIRDECTIDLCAYQHYVISMYVYVLCMYVLYVYICMYYVMYLRMSADALPCRYVMQDRVQH